MIIAFKKTQISQINLTLLVALFMTTFLNISFFQGVHKTYGFEGMNILYVSSTFILLYCVNVFLLSLFSFKYIVKPVFITLLLISSITAYFMDTYNIVIDTIMLTNSMETDPAETFDLLSLNMLAYFICFGVIPSLYIYFVDITYNPLKNMIIKRFALFIVIFSILGTILLSFSQFYSSFFREHKPLRFSANPTYWIYSVVKFSKSLVPKPNIVVQTIGEDAIIDKNKRTDKNRFFIAVVGETLRAQNIPFNGYERNTLPLLSKIEDLVNFNDMNSCGTSTATSVPCMFSKFNKDNFDLDKEKETENGLDILKKSGVVVIWRDNNSSSKGVAQRIGETSYKSDKVNKICDQECRDEGMLEGIENIIKENPGKDILLILHQMGNHGPAYYKRFPKEFEKFKPICKTNQLEQCSSEEIINAYDNAILYTDYFLNKTINKLKELNNFEAGMFYMSDHGESLGENGLYLHGMPMFMAPIEQTKVASFVWFNDNFKSQLDFNNIIVNSKKSLSHDTYFHTLLGLYGISTKEYNEDMDLFHMK